MTQHFDDLSDALYEITWYAMPLRMQKRFPLMISVAQRKVYLRGMGNVRCTRQMFMKVVQISRYFATFPNLKFFSSFFSDFERCLLVLCGAQEIQLLGMKCRTIILTFLTDEVRFGFCLYV